MLDGIDERLAALTPAQRRVAHILSRGYPELIFATAEEIAARANVSRSTFLRTLTALDYPGLVELQGQVRRELADLLAPPDRWKSAAVATSKDELELVQEVAANEQDNIQATFARLPANLADAARVVAAADRVFVMGERKGRSLATYLAVQLAQMRPDVLEIGTVNELGLQVADLRLADAVVLFDVRRHGRATHTVGTLARQAGATVISIADSPRLPTSRAADIVLTFETKTVSPFLSYTAGFALVNALVAFVVKELGAEGREYASKAERATRALLVFEGQTAFVEPSDGSALGGTGIDDAESSE